MNRSVPPRRRAQAGDATLGEPRATAAPLGWRQGFTVTIPFTITVGALGIVFGATAGTVGLSGAATVAMSVFVFSGAAQFSALGLWAEGAAAVLLATALLGSRFLLMSASMALRLPGLTRWQRFLLANTIIDESYGLFIAAGPGAGASFLLGSMAALYTPWLLGTWLGVQLGPLVPVSWQPTLEAIFPLVFLVLVVLTSGTRSKAVVATVAAVLAVGCAVWLPGGWGLLIAGLAASAVGPWLAKRLDRRDGDGEADGGAVGEPPGGAAGEAADGLLGGSPSGGGADGGPAASVEAAAAAGGGDQ